MPLHEMQCVCVLFHPLKSQLLLQVLHSLSKERLELVMGLSDYVSDRVTPLLKPVDKCWQPADFLPDPSQEDYLDQVSWHISFAAMTAYTAAGIQA